MRNEIPAASGIAIVVDPGAEDEVGCYGKEDTVARQDTPIYHSPTSEEGVEEKAQAYIITNQVKKPQCPPLDFPPLSSAPSHAYFVCHSRLSTFSSPTSS